MVMGTLQLETCFKLMTNRLKGIVVGQTNHKTLELIKISDICKFNEISF